MVGVRRLKNLHDLAHRAIDEGVPGDFIETAVWRGGWCILMHGVLKVNGIIDRKVYAADSFAGCHLQIPTGFNRTQATTIPVTRNWPCVDCDLCRKPKTSSSTALARDS
jgi:Macrocin-O-methyltransferase (TylF)